MPNINGRYYMNPNYGAAMERSRQAEGGGTFDAIVKSIESGSTRPLLEEILRGSKDSLVQPDGQNDSSHTPKIVPVAAQATASQNQQYAPSSASARDSTQRQAHDDSDGHWVTIDHRHVLIQGSQGNHPQHAHQAAAKANQQKRKDIADIARSIITAPLGLLTRRRTIFRRDLTSVTNSSMM